MIVLSKKYINDLPCLNNCQLFFSGIFSYNNFIALTVNCIFLNEVNGNILLASGTKIKRDS